MRVSKQRLRKKYDCVFSTSMGKLGVVVDAGQVAAIDFLQGQASLQKPKNKAVSRIVSKIKGYFLKPQTKFNLIINLQGMLLQQKIWRLLQKIPVGKTITYGELAQKVGTSPRVIGNACRLNPLPIIIPCHRVIAKSGLGGYCGQVRGKPSKIKRWLLQHEKAI